jgi:hypothetical protein
MARVKVGIAAAALALLAAGSALAQGLSPDLKGSYAPGGNCAKEPRVTIGDALTVVAGGKTTRYAPVDACYSCAGGARYEGIEVWVTYLDRNKEPASPMFRVNADEKRGALVVDRDPAAPPPMRAVAAASPLRKCAK